MSDSRLPTEYAMIARSSTGCGHQSFLNVCYAEGQLPFEVPFILRRTKVHIDAGSSPDEAWERYSQVLNLGNSKDRG